MPFPDLCSGMCNIDDFEQSLDSSLIMKPVLFKAYYSASMVYVRLIYFQCTEGAILPSISK